MAIAGKCVVVALLLTGCVSWFRPPAPISSTSTPTGEKVAADLQPFYSQVVKWSSCSGSFQCADVTAPMNWKDPSKASIKLALIRKPATGNRLGSLLVNPGGPGASGYDFIHDSLSYAVDSTLRANYDIVGFDPRGVGHSTAVNCGGATPSTPARPTTAGRLMNTSCIPNGPLTRVDTGSTACSSRRAPVPGCGIPSVPASSRMSGPRSARA